MFRANKNNFETPVMYVQCSEVGLFRKQQKSQHGGLDFEIIKNGYDGDKYECGTAGKDGVSGFIRNLYLSLNISATVPAIRMHTPTEALNDGAANRMCFCFFKKDYYINPITGHKQKIKTVAQPYNSEAIAQYVDWARRQQGLLDFAEIFGDAGDENNTIYEYFDIHCTKGYEYLKDLTERNYVSAMRVVREYYLMDLYEKGEMNLKAIVGVPVGFVGAADSKEALSNSNIPNIIVEGPKGGTPIAVACVNSLIQHL